MIGTLWARHAFPAARCSYTNPWRARMAPRIQRYASRTTPDEKPTRLIGRQRPAWSRVTRFCYYGTAVVLALHISVTYFYSCNSAYGISMLPTIQSFGDAVIVSKYYRKGRDVKVGDVISFKHPFHEGERAIKRVLAMPGDFVLRDTPGVGAGMMIQIPTGHCYVVGDNLTWSNDSRIFGPVPLALVSGKVIARWHGWFSLPQLIQHGLQDHVPDIGADDDAID